MWQKDQLVTQLHWQENGPTFSNTPYRYQACRCETPEGSSKRHSLDVVGEREETGGKLGRIVALVGVTLGLTRVQEGTNL